MIYINISKIIFLDLIIFAISQINNWNLLSSSINILPLNLPYYERLIFNETKNGKNIQIIKSITRKDGQIINETIMNFEGNDFVMSKFENLQTFYYFNDKYYVLPKENNIWASDYNMNKTNTSLLMEIPVSIQNESNERPLKSIYINEMEQIFFIFLNSYNNNFIYIKEINDIETKDYKHTYVPFTVKIYDYFIYLTKTNNSNFFYINLILLKEGKISLLNCKIENRSFYLIKSFVIIDDVNYYSHSYLYFYKETKIFYFMLYNTVFDFISGYSLKEIEEDINNTKNIPIYKNNDSPLKIFGESKINYLKFIRNTRFAYYEIEANKIIYHGILDIKLNKIIYNTKDYIKDFRPLSNYSMLAITNDRAFEICPFNKDGKCVEDCYDGEELILDYNKGNYCSIPKGFNYALWIPIIVGSILVLIIMVIVIIFIVRKKKDKEINLLNDGKEDDEEVNGKLIDEGR